MDRSDPMIKKKSSPSSVAPVLIWKVLTLVFIVISIALLIALIVVATKKNKSEQGTEDATSKSPVSNGATKVESCGDGLSRPDRTPKSAGVFIDLTVDEITAVRDYLLKQTKINLTKYEKATVNDNYIYLVQLLPPSKDEVLAYLDSGGAMPERKAIAVVFHGATDPPMVREYIISPVANPMKHVIRKVPGRQRDFVPFNARPFDMGVEYPALHEAVVKNAAEKLSKLMRESYDGYSYLTDCSKKCFGYLYTAPMGFTGDDRQTWIYFVRSLTGEVDHPVDLQILVNTSGPDASKWKILNVIYNNQTFLPWMS